MKKIYTIIILSLLITGCSKDEPETPVKEYPTIESISSSTGNDGDIITINGNNFKTGENYLVQFNGVEGNIVEINSNYIKVEIPENATSGDITLTYNNQTTVIGQFSIGTSTTNSFKLYALKIPESTSSSTKFIQIDPDSGNETELLDLMTNQFIENPVFDKENNKVIGVREMEDENGITNELHTIDLTSSTFNSVSLSDNAFYELWTSNEGELFAVKQSNSTSTKLLKIDPSTGNETEIMDLQTNESMESLLFDEQKNVILGVSFTENENGSSNKLFIIDVTTNNLETLDLDNNVFYELSLSNEGELFAVKQSNSASTKFIKINPNTGDETEILDLQTNQSVEDLVFNEEKDIVLGVSFIENVNGESTNSLYSIDVSDNSFEKVDLKDGVYYELVHQ